jgi:hypothetical protein
MTSARSALVTWLALGTLGCTSSWHPPGAREDAGSEDAGPANDGAVLQPDAAGSPDDDAGVDLPDASAWPDANEPDAGCDEVACRPPVRSTGFEGERCSSEGARTCAGPQSARRLVCTGGALRYTGPCGAASVCDATPGVAETGRCVALGRCDDFEPSSGVGCVGALRVRCDATGAATELLSCQEHAHCEGPGQCACDSGYRLGEFVKTCEPISITGVISRGGGGVYCSGPSVPQLGDARGFWVAVLFRTQDVIVSTRAIASQQAAGGGWAFVESEEGLRFELGSRREDGTAGTFRSASYPITPELSGNRLTQLAVGVFDGENVRLHVGNAAVDKPAPARFSPVDARLCVLGELGAGSLADVPVASSVTALFGLAGGSPALSDDELAQLFAETRRDAVLGSIKNKTQFAFGFAAEGAGYPFSVANTAGPQLELQPIGQLLVSEGPLLWAY